MPQNVAWYGEQRLMLNPVGIQSQGWHCTQPDSPKSLSYKFVKQTLVQSLLSAAFSFTNTNSSGLGTIAASAGAGAGYICREGSLLSRFVKCETWNRAPCFRPWPPRVRADQSWVQENNYFRGTFMLHLSHVSLLTKASSFHNNAGANCYAFVARQTLLTVFSLASLPSLQPAGVLGCTLKSRATSLKANPQIAQSSRHSEPL